MKCKRFRELISRGPGGTPTGDRALGLFVLADQSWSRWDMPGTCPPETVIWTCPPEAERQTPHHFVTKTEASISTVPQSIRLPSYFIVKRPDCSRMSRSV